MDSLILEGVVRILDRALAGRSLLRWDRLGEGDYLLRFATAAGDNLRISLQPPFPALYRLPHRHTPEVIPEDPFSGAAARALEGAALAGMRRHGADRVVELDWEAASGAKLRLVVELLGKSANLLLLDEESRVMAFARKMASAFRRPEEGKTYQPPLPRPGLEGASLDPRRVEAMLQRFNPALPPAEAAIGLLQFLSPPLAEDFPHRAGARQDPVGELRRMLEAAAGDRLEPAIYAPHPPADLMALAATHTAPALLAPLRLEHPPVPLQASFEDCEQAVGVFARLTQAQHAARELREKVSGALQREQGKLARLAAKLEEEQRETAQSGAHQRFGDLILACPSARVAGAVIEVPDLYGEPGATVRVPADPALTPRENAQRHYARARKLRRGKEKIRERLEEVGAQAAKLSELERRLAEAKSPADLESLEGALVAAKLLLPARRKKTDAAKEPAGENDPGIRKYRTEDGFVILVGKTSRDNDHLTFRVAAPHDFWFHAAGHSGAHVVVRNPGRLKELPKSVALSAARLAAHYSRAKGGKVEVHFTLRKHVRKGKGYAPGLVSLRNHRTLEVEPGIPGGGSD